MSKKRQEYAAYRGDEFLDIGTADYLAQKLGTTIAVIRWCAGSKRYRSQNHKRGLIIIPLGEEEE